MESGRLVNDSMKLKAKVYRFLNGAEDGYGPAKKFNSFMIVFITIIIINVIIQTMHGMPESVFLFGRVLDLIAAVIFTIEYILRVWSCTDNPLYKRKGTADTAIMGRLRYMASGLAIIDLIAIIALDVPFFFHQQETYAIVGLFKLFTMFKLVRYSPSLLVIINVFNAKKRELGMMLYITLFLLIVTSTLMFFIEHQAQPEKFASIPDSMWWAVITLTTVGYGDVYPITPLGRFFGGISALLGVGLFALPAGILASAFMQEISNNKKKKEPETKTVKCPKCGCMVPVDEIEDAEE